MYENARKGLGKIYTAEILTIFVVIIGIVSAVILVVLGKVLKSDGASVNTADVVSFVSMLVALVLGIVSFFLNLFGIISASKDDEGFKNALYMVIIGIIASIVASILKTKHPSIAGYFETINDVSELFVFYYVISGCVNIARAKKNDALVATGNRTKVIIIVIWVISLVLNFFKGSLEAKGTVGGIFTAIAIIGGIASIVSYILYLVIIRKTINTI